jgi:1,4-alpha-glucan branching enzyme
MKKTGDTSRKRVQVEIKAEPGTTVFIAGTFNGWNPTEKPLNFDEKDGVYRAKVLLPVGRHEYKFVVGGEWQADPACPQWTPNEFGSLNSVMTVN